MFWHTHFKLLKLINLNLNYQSITFFILTKDSLIRWNNQLYKEWQMYIKSLFRYDSNHLYIFTKTCVITNYALIYMYMIYLLQTTSIEGNVRIEKFWEKMVRNDYDFFCINWVRYFSMMYHDLLWLRTFPVVYKCIVQVETKLLFAFHLKLG